MMFGALQSDTTTTGTCQCIAAPCNCSGTTNTGNTTTPATTTANAVSDTFNELKTWFEANKTLAIGGGIAILAVILLSRR